MSAVDHPANVTTWADGHGVWHVRVPRNAAGALIGARRGIRDELVARAPRGEIVPRHFWADLEPVANLSDADTLVYRERAWELDDAGEPFAQAGECRREGGHVVPHEIRPGSVCGGCGQYVGDAVEVA